MQHQPESRQQQILNLLLANKQGLSIDDISQQLEISRNAVKQHMVVLEKNQLIKAAQLTATGGRPARRYELTESGINQFSKQYSWFCNLMISEMKEEMGEQAFAAFMHRLGGKVAASLADQFKSQGADEKVVTLVNIMQNLGYQSSIKQEGDEVTISAVNCVFHDLANANNELCEFDRALFRALLDHPVEQTECMAKGGCACKFKTRV